VNTLSTGRLGGPSAQCPPLAPIAGRGIGLEARLLLSSDDHVRGMDFTRLSFELQDFDVIAPIIATPAEVGRKFFLSYYLP
jgi:hypothetical protein